ncbi:hypothetical protein CAEBREN_01181 [Caenorhabditis brenneri]|uniref:RING-type domain-containing protein n=1 Tax=Caenorhabditis brenneri TaxID=135651 RepID=G0PA41_CAEBE|nr:hypothetical protein CAEBREN_01181 [Caenorhabditis brenneri]
MPASKRPLADAVQETPASKRGVGATEPPSDDNPVVRLLRECIQKQRANIACVENNLKMWRHRFIRLQPHMQFQLRIEEERGHVENAIKEQIKHYEKEIADANRKETMLKFIVKEMTEQEDKLEKIAQDIVNYKGYQFPGSKKVFGNEPNLGSFENELDDALQRIPINSKNDLGMKTLPKLEKSDLDVINWPGIIRDWSNYSICWNKEIEEAAECRELSKMLSEVENEMQQAVAEYNTVQTRKISIQLYDENWNRSDNIRHIEQTDLSSCGHTVCATCMPQFKARNSPYQWTCHECRTPSDKVLTNWALMKLIKEIPGQPQRVVVEAPKAIPIAPDGWRLERNPDADVLRGLWENYERRRVNGDLIAPFPAGLAAVALPIIPPALVPLPLLAPAPVAMAPIAPGPVALIPQPVPVLAAQLAPAPREERGVIEEERQVEEEHVPVADVQEQMDDDLEIIAVRIRERQQVVENGVEYIVLD